MQPGIQAHMHMRTHLEIQVGLEGGHRRLGGLLWGSGGGWACRAGGGSGAHHQQRRTRQVGGVEVDGQEERRAVVGVAPTPGHIGWPRLQQHRRGPWASSLLLAVLRLDVRTHGHARTRTHAHARTECVVAAQRSGWLHNVVILGARGGRTKAGVADGGVPVACARTCTCPCVPPHWLAAPASGAATALAVCSVRNEALP